MIDKNESTIEPIIKDVPDMSDIMPESKTKKISLKFKIIFGIILGAVIIAMITLIVLSIVSFKGSDDENKEDDRKKPEPPIDDTIYGKIFCKYLLKEDIDSNILFEGYTAPEKFEVFVDGIKIDNYHDYKLNKKGEYNITYLIKQNNFSMNNMFTEVKNLISVDMISTENCSLLTIEQAFEKCEDLIDFSIQGFITKNLTSLKSLFSSTSLSEIHFEDFDSSSVTDMSYMFSKTKMKNLELNFLSTINVVNMEHMFSHCTDLISLDISNFDIQNLKSMKNMFTHLESISYLNLENLDLKNVEEMSN